MDAGIQALLAWTLLFSGEDGVLEESSVDYGGLLEQMEAAELLTLIEQAQARLAELGGAASAMAAEPVRLFINKEYTIRLGVPDGMELPLRPLVKALFILFLKHPEGIRLKERGCFEVELREIYSVIAPNVAPEIRQRRVARLMDPADNAFSENSSSLNARLEVLFPDGTAGHYKIQGYNGYPRRIQLDPLLVTWE